ncbi:MAG: DNA primase [Pseudomonadota bacterium]
MSFPTSFLDEIRARIGLAELIGRRVQLRKQGREHQGLCPFHNEKTPSFTVSEDKGFYHCFGCGAHGDAIGFVMNSEGLAFPEAVEKLAAEAGLEVPRDQPRDPEAEKRRADLFEVLEQATQWFEAQLAGQGGAEARDYLAGRGVTDGTRAAFRLGFAPKQRGSLRQAMNAKGIADGQLIEAGLIKAPEDDRPAREYFFDRIVFPITDRRGRVIAFGGRAIGPAKAKYLNSPEGPLFHKGRVLYNLAGARQAAHDTGELIVAEGYMDVIALAGAGFPAAVAPLGTAVTAEQVTLLWRLAREPVLCLDGDAAGRKAAARAAETALPLLSPGRSLRFALLPEGEDPDSLVAGAGPTALRRLLDRAIGLADLLWLAASEGKDLRTPERQAGLWRELETKIKAIEDPTLQAAYRESLTQRFEKSFGYNPFGRGRPRGQRRSSARQAPKGQPLSGRGLRQSPATLSRRREQVLLAAAVNHPLLVLEHAEELACMEIGNRDLARFTEALVNLAASQPDLDTEALKCHLCEQGFTKVLEGLLTPRVYVLGRFARPETPIEQVRHEWSHVLAVHRESQSASKSLATAHY